MNNQILEQSLVSELSKFGMPGNLLKAIIKRVIISAEQEGESLELFRQKLSKGIVKFQYKKQDGSMREAWGTLNPMIIASIIGRLKVGNEKKQDSCITYFDLERKDWRCFTISKFLGACD